jgi:hypothetical protein
VHTYSVATGDFGNGLPDIVSVNNQNPGYVSIFMNTGTSSLYPSKATHTYSLGSVQPSSVIAADLNGDGKLDLVITNHNTNTVGIMTGNGDGTFQPMVTYKVGNGPEYAVIATFNNDCWPDIAVADDSGSALTILFNQGKGKFTTSSLPIISPTTPNTIAFANVNGDFYSSSTSNNGKPVEDMLVANPFNNSVSLLLGSKTTAGSFGAAKTVGFVDSGPYSISVANLTGKTFGSGSTAYAEEDIITANYFANDLSILLGNGNGTFKSPLTIAVGNSPTWVGAADLNDDGKIDLVVTNGGDNTVSVLINNGNDSSGNPTFKTAVTYSVGNYPYEFGLADMTGNTYADGTPIRDIEVVNYNDNTLTVLRNNGNGTFVTKSTTPVGIGPEFLAAGNFDGKEDAVVANNVDGTLTFLPGNGDGTFGTASTIAVDDGPTAIGVADLNGDGKPDLAVSSYDKSVVDVLLGNGNGTFGTSTNPVAAALPVGVGPSELRVNDVTGDGHADIETANYGGNSMSVLLNTGTFASPFTLSMASAVTYSDGIPSNPIAVAIADLNGDGKPDLATANYNANTVSVVLGNGDGTFQSPEPAIGVGNGPYGIVAADLNGDGKPDLATVNYFDNTVSVLVNQGNDNNGNPIFQNTSTPAVGGGPNAIAVGDLNGDGIPDIVTANYGAGTISVLLGKGNDANGNPTYQTAATFTTLPNPWYVILADVNGDGKPDIIVSNPYSSDFSVFINTTATGASTPTFAARKDYGLSDQGAYYVTAGDFNGDGHIDIATADNYANRIAVYLNNGDGTFPNTPSHTVYMGSGAAPYFITTGDFNRDGKKDLVVANQGYNNISVLYGNGAGTFAPPQSYQVGTTPNFIATGDFNNDGATDLAVTNSGTNDVSVLINHAEADHLLVSAPSTVTAGTPFTITVTAETVCGNVANYFTGTVHFSSSDVLAGLPPDYTFTAADQGVHSFTVTLETAGTRSITARDTLFPADSGSASVLVVPAPASTFSLSAPGSATAGVAFTATLTAYDPFGNVATGYRGTVHFTKTDGGAGSSVPAN